MKSDQTIAGYPAPTVGDDIYVGSAMYIDHGEDDVVGGLARVVSVFVGLSAGKETYFVTVAEHPGHLYNWALLKHQQADLKGRFGQRRAYADPDHGIDVDGARQS